LLTAGPPVRGPTAQRWRFGYSDEDQDDDNQSQ
jgi:hypothetical protein